MTQFVVIYDRASGHSVIRSFNGADAAQRALSERFAAERAAGPTVEVASLAADSIEDLKITHARYFKRSREVLGDFDAAVA